VKSTENARQDRAPQDRAPRWFQRVLPVSGLVLLVLALAALALPAFRGQVGLSASHRPDPYVELYFARTAAGTQVVCTSSAGKAEVRFAVTSHLDDEQDLAYDVTVGDDEKSGSVALEPGETAEVAKSVARTGRGRYDVSVTLPDTGQQLTAHCPGAR
jgi:hypothetical protein